MLVIWLPMEVSYAQPTGMSAITGGSYVPFYGSDTAVVTVDNFLIDQYPVTNEEFLEFVKKYPSWQRSQVKRLFAEEAYLTVWESDTVLGNAVLPQAPVTYVSWFAAKHYCQCQGKRLPTMEEWEFLAIADKQRSDAREDATFHQAILQWYEQPAPKVLPEVGNTEKNYWGVYDLHGLVWEWVLNFNSVMITGESRNDTALDRNLYCAGGALASTDLMNYAAFMRFAFRSSLKASYTLKNLGFRCAGVKDKEL